MGNKLERDSTPINERLSSNDSVKKNEEIKESTVGNVQNVNFSKELDTEYIIVDSSRGVRKRKSLVACDNIDFDRRDSILTKINLKHLINKETFEALPLESRKKVLSLLPKSDCTRPPENCHGDDKSSPFPADSEDSSPWIHPTALSNEFLSKALQDYSDRQINGEFSPRPSVRPGLRNTVGNRSRYSASSKNVTQSVSEDTSDVPASTEQIWEITSSASDIQPSISNNLKTTRLSSKLKLSICDSRSDSTFTSPTATKTLGEYSDKYNDSSVNLSFLTERPSVSFPQDTDTNNDQRITTRLTRKRKSFAKNSTPVSVIGQLISSSGSLMFTESPLLSSKSNKTFSKATSNSVAPKSLIDDVSQSSRLSETSGELNPNDFGILAMSTSSLNVHVKKCDEDWLINTAASTPLPYVKSKIFKPRSPLLMCGSLFPEKLSKSKDKKSGFINAKLESDMHSSPVMPPPRQTKTLASVREKLRAKRLLRENQQSNGFQCMSPLPGSLTPNPGHSYTGNIYSSPSSISSQHKSSSLCKSPPSSTYSADCESSPTSDCPLPSSNSRPIPVDRCNRMDYSDFRFTLQDLCSDVFNSYSPHRQSLTSIDSRLLISNNESNLVKPFNNIMDFAQHSVSAPTTPLHEQLSSSDTSPVSRIVTSNPASALPSSRESPIPSSHASGASLFANFKQARVVLAPTLPCSSVDSEKESVSLPSIPFLGKTHNCCSIDQKIASTISSTIPISSCNSVHPYTSSLPIIKQSDDISSKNLNSCLTNTNPSTCNAVSLCNGITTTRAFIVDVNKLSETLARFQSMNPQATVTQQQFLLIPSTDKTQVFLYRTPTSLPITSVNQAALKPPESMVSSVHSISPSDHTMLATSSCTITSPVINMSKCDPSRSLTKFISTSINSQYTNSRKMSVDDSGGWNITAPHLSASRSNSIPIPKPQIKPLISDCSIILPKPTPCPILNDKQSAYREILPLPLNCQVNSASSSFRFTSDHKNEFLVSSPSSSILSAAGQVDMLDQQRRVMGSLGFIPPKSPQSLRRTPISMVENNNWHHVDQLTSLRPFPSSVVPTSSLRRISPPPTSSACLMSFLQNKPNKENGKK